MENPIKSETAQAQRTTPFRLAETTRQGLYFGREIDDAAYGMYDGARQASSAPDGRVDRGKMRAEFDKFAVEEIGDGVGRLLRGHISFIAKH